MLRCANCGVGEDDNNNTKLKNCSACKSVRYCGVKCQKEHRKKHKRACKKRVAELRDEILFRQPESTHWGDCPICFLPIPLGDNERMDMVCCGQYICIACFLANAERKVQNRLEIKCPFCRKMRPKSKAESLKMQNERATEKNCPISLVQVGKRHHRKGDFHAAFQFSSRAAALGDADGHAALGGFYWEGEGVEKDMSKAICHFERAAIAGHPGARHNLGCIESDNGQIQRAVKHWIISAKQGQDSSLENVKQFFKDGLVSKEDFAAALRGHQAAMDATKSPQREKAVEYLKRIGNIPSE